RNKPADQDGSRRNSNARGRRSPRNDERQQSSSAKSKSDARPPQQNKNGNANRSPEGRGRGRGPRKESQQSEENGDPNTGARNSSRRSASGRRERNTTDETTNNVNDTQQAQTVVTGDNEQSRPLDTGRINPSTSENTLQDLPKPGNRSDRSTEQSGRDQGNETEYANSTSPTSEVSGNRALPTAVATRVLTSPEVNLAPITVDLSQIPKQTGPSTDGPLQPSMFDNEHDLGNR
ncbi:MAG: hypothetical protein O3C28_20605, partial [Proteobacteria bacterium]|nr:hypothetical protein [Pseudomonadota bacterium]